LSDYFIVGRLDNERMITGNAGGKRNDIYIVKCDPWAGQGSRAELMHEVYYFTD